jgi:hypothetical protein
MVALAEESVVALADSLAMVWFGVRFLVLFLCSIKGLLLVVSVRRACGRLRRCLSLRRGGTSVVRVG